MNGHFTREVKRDSVGLFVHFGSERHRASIRTRAEEGMWVQMRHSFWNDKRKAFITLPSGKKEIWLRRKV